MAQGQLIRLDRAARGAPKGQFTLDMEIRLYRDKFAAQGDDARRTLVGAVWDAVSEELAQGGRKTAGKLTKG